ncbi:MAG: D-3-phosphoglycerate dehydrogenase / 2-oxoglutarate reductase, partial [Frankiaceae bacterium]|nr:D-3-phosphoglycerate dehydrogenase / 2-oxoglutarate reductase [Frankiaceae bacterium]
PMRGAGFDQLKTLVDVVYEPFIEQRPLRLYSDEQLAERVLAEAATVIVCEGDRVGPKTLDLKPVVVGATRGDPTNVDVAAATERGVPVLHAPGRNADAVAELTVGLLFAAARHVVPADGDVRAGETYRDGTIPYQRFRGWELNGRTAGIVGYGAIGRALAWRLTGLGMRVIAYDPYAAEATASLDDVLAEADVVSMHAPVTPETMQMIGEKQFAQMKPGAIYLNAARAALHDLEALVGALQSGHLAGAGLDHFDGEVLPPDSPLAKLPNVVLTPHIGGATYDTEANHSVMMAEGIGAILRGDKPTNCINPEVLS